MTCRLPLSGVVSKPACFSSSLPSFFQEQIYPGARCPLEHPSVRLNSWPCLISPSHVGTISPAIGPSHRFHHGRVPLRGVRPHTPSPTPSKPSKARSPPDTLRWHDEPHENVMLLLLKLDRIFSPFWLSPSKLSGSREENMTDALFVCAAIEIGKGREGQAADCVCLGACRRHAGRGASCFLGCWASTATLHHDSSIRE